MNDLKPCPFCDGKAEHLESHGWHGIGCNTDRCPALMHALMFRTFADAAAVWNRRAGVTASFGTTEQPVPCTVCALLPSEHGSYPTCATHPYTPDGNCQHVIGAKCVGAECKNGCVRARGLDAPAEPLSVSRKAVIKKCRGGRTEHLMEPEWEGRSYAFMKCRWCGKREAV